MRTLRVNGLSLFLIVFLISSITHGRLPDFQEINSVKKNVKKVELDFIVKAIDGVPSCVVSLVDGPIEFSGPNEKLENLPACKQTEGSDEQIKLVIEKVYENKKVEKTASITHISAGLAGCYGGFLSQFIGGFIQFNTPSFKESLPRGTGNIVGFTLFEGAVLTAALTVDPTGHALAAAIGGAICAGGVTYLVFGLVD